MNYRKAWNELEGWIKGKRQHRQSDEQAPLDNGAISTFGAVLQEMENLEGELKPHGAGPRRNTFAVTGELLGDVETYQEAWQTLIEYLESSDDCHTVKWVLNDVIPRINIRQRPDEDGGPLTPGGTDDPEDPAHYTLFGGDVETMDLIRDRTDFGGFVGYLEGNAIKYLMRWRRKHDSNDDRIADLKKCRMYIDLLIDALEGGE